ncbi:MAG: hypothetical protein Q4B58_08430 [Bacteroidales bacterium]|nr:hypothetical protein [Bacteroidales bacterium]
MKVLKCFLFMTGVCACTLAHAQNKSDVSQYVDWGLEVANNHLWRGIEVSDGLVMCTDLAIHDQKEHFKFGLWGGTNTSGNYKEFNFFGEVEYGAFKLALWDTYNFSPGADYNNKEFFNYSARTTGRFLDCNLTWDAAQNLQNFPLTLQWSTIIFGRDRWQDNSANRYSTFVYAEYPLYRTDVWSFHAGIGGTFTLASKKGDSSTFYSDKAGIIHIQMSARYNLKVTSRYTLPVFATAVFNPVMDRAYFQIGAQIFKF